jgi:hypothetical protein
MRIPDDFGRLLSLVLIHRKPSAMRALRRRRPLAIYENTSKIISPIVCDRRWPSAMTSQETKKFVSCDHRRLPPAWKIYEKWVKVVFSSTSKEIINWSLTEIMNFTLNGAMNGAILCLGALVGNFETHRLSSATITDVWELSCIRDRRASAIRRRRGKFFFRRQSDSSHPRSQGLSAARVLPRPWDTPNRNCKKTCTNF